MANEKAFKLFVDGDKYDWDQATINGAQLRKLASIPQGVQIFEKIPGKPDREVLDNTTVDLAAHHGPVHFSTQAPGSSAG